MRAHTSDTCTANREDKHTGKALGENICIKFYWVFVDFFEKVRIICFCMDTKNDSKIPKCGSLPDLTGQKVIVGAKQLKKALLSGRAKRVFLAENADPAITEPIAELCRQKSIRFSWVCSMAELGRCCGIEVGAAAAAVVN